MPAPWCEDFSFHLNSLFTRLKIVGKEKKQGNLTDEITNMTAIFRAHTECEKPRVVLIEGEPGMGKTTYCQKVAYDWATKRCEWDESFPKIEVLLLLKCSDITSDNIWKAIDDQILPDDIQEEDKEAFFQFIRENQSKVLLVIDGLDEALPDNLTVCFKLVERRDLPDCHIVLSSRHEAGKQVRRHCDTLWEIVGFKEEDARSFIRKYFRTQKDLAEKLIRELWPDIFWWNCFKGCVDLRQLTKNPLHTALLCTLYEDFKGSLPTKRTELYIEIVLCVMRRYEKKNGISSSTEDLIEKYKENMVYLGRMAFKAYCEGQSYFEEHEFGDTVSSLLIKFGFLSVQHGGSKRKPCHRFGFLHRSFQEFFSGFYLAFRISDEDLHYFISCKRYSFELKEVFLFMSGIAASICQETTVSIVSRVASLIADPHALSFALMFISECTTYKENVKAMLVDTFNNYFQLKTIEMRNFSLNISLLSEVLAVNSTLTNLDLGWNSIGKEGATSLSQALTVNSTLTSLNLRYNSIGDEGATSLSQALKVNSTLTSLDLGLNRVGEEGATSLSQALKVNSTLTSLDLGWNSIGEEGATSLSQALTVNSTLTSLNLRYNSIGDEGATSLSQALKVNSTLTSLDLSDNSIGDEGATSLSQALKVNSTLTSLDLSMNSIGEEGATSLSQALKVNSTLTSLNLRYNSIGEEGATSLSQALKVNSTLTSLNLRNNSIGEEGATSLSQALKVNSTLTNLDLVGTVLVRRVLLPFPRLLK